jgi:cell division protein ZapA (FtsZ GTPase activity inhibitor)
VTTREAAEIIVQLTREVASVRRESDSYRLVAVAGIHHSHDLQLENARLRRTNQHLQDEYRRFRAEVQTSLQLLGVDNPKTWLPTGSETVSQVTM